MHKYKWANKCVTFHFFVVCVVKKLTLFSRLSDLMIAILFRRVKPFQHIVFGDFSYVITMAISQNHSRKIISSRTKNSLC